MSLNLDAQHIPMTKDVQDNLQKIHTKLGSHFVIIHGAYRVPVILEQTKHDYNNLSYWTLKYNEPRLVTPLLPFKIDFFDLYTTETNNRAYIANVHRTHDISGTEMMNLIIHILQYLHVETVFLHDGTSVPCTENVRNDLSLFKLIEKGSTFYQKFGFQPDFPPSTFITFQFENSKNWNQQLDKTLTTIRGLKTQHIHDAYQKVADLVNCVVKDQGYQYVDVQMVAYLDGEPRYVKKNEIRRKVMEIFADTDYILSMTRTSQHEYLYELLIELFYKDCSAYRQLLDILGDNMIRTISYNPPDGVHQKIIFKHIQAFFLLYSLRQVGMRLDVSTAKIQPIKPQPSQS